MLIKLRELIEFVKGFILKTLGKNTDGYKSEHLEPSELVGIALEAICKMRMSWPDLTELPSYVEIELNVTDYEYYVSRLDLCQKYIVETASRYAQQNNCIFEIEPIVHLYPNPNLPVGVAQAFASFTDDSDEETKVSFNTMETEVMADKPANSENHSNAPQTPATEQMPKPSQPTGEPGIPPTAVMKQPWSSKKSSDSESKQPVGHLTYGDHVIEVHPDDTLGHMRASNQKKPCIDLEGEPFKYVSLAHGHFEFKNRWFFVDDGSSNGTSVKRRGVLSKLLPNKPFALEDNDVLSFGNSIPVLFSCK